MVYWCFPSLLNIPSLTRNTSLYKEVNCGYCQDTKQADRADQKWLFDVNSRFYNRDIWVKKVSFLLYLVLLPLVFLVKALVFGVSMYCLKNHNVEFSQTALAGCARKNA
jgi:hypothetical protein